MVAHNSQAIAGEVSCKCWSCKECGPKREKEWLERFKMFAETSVNFEITYCKTVRERNALTQRLARNRIHFITIRVKDSFEVIHTPIPENRQYKPDRSTWMNYSKMIENVRLIIRRALKDGLSIRITASTGIPKVKTKPKKWVLVTKTPISIEEMNRRLAKHFETSIYLGVPFSASKIAALIGDDFEMSRLESTSSEVKEKIFRELGATALAMISEMTFCGSKCHPIGIDDIEW
ncbi:MAG: hypothetical protein EBW87_01360 [Burkholderiaceae bacterium]|nr:hypothetical protein [Burkholderiaceae bacterium]